MPSRINSDRTHMDDSVLAHCPELQSIPLNKPQLAAIGGNKVFRPQQAAYMFENLPITQEKKEQLINEFAENSIKAKTLVIPAHKYEARTLDHLSLMATISRPKAVTSTNSRIEMVKALISKSSVKKEEATSRAETPEKTVNTGEEQHEQFDNYKNTPVNNHSITEYAIESEDEGYEEDMEDENRNSNNRTEARKKARDALWFFGQTQIGKSTLRTDSDREEHASDIHQADNNRREARKKAREARQRERAEATANMTPLQQRLYDWNQEVADLTAQANAEAETSNIPEGVRRQYWDTIFRQMDDKLAAINADQEAENNP
jgi:hypothetical protein